MKTVYLVLILSLTLTLGAGARGAQDVQPLEKHTVRMIVPGGATLATVALLDGDSIAPDYTLDLEVAQSADVIAAKIIGGEADLAVIPTNLAAVLANKGTGIRIAAPAIWGLLYVVSSEELDGIADLKGRSVNMLGRGLTPDITFRHLLEENGLVPDEDVEISYASSAAELAPTFLTGRSTISMMPEPMITTVLTKKPQTHILLDVQEEWAKRYGASYPQAGLVVAGDFADDHSDFLADFRVAFEEAVAMAVSDPERAGNAAAALSNSINPQIFAAAIPRMNLRYVPAVEARSALEEYYRVLETFNPATIGGKLPADDFYAP